MEQQDNVARRTYRAVVHKGKQAAQFEKVRFMMVGVANTITDFVVLLSLVSVWGVHAAVANIASTTCALIVSFSLNKKAVFPESKPMTAHAVIVFIAVTLAGIWFVQTVIMTQLYNLLKGWLHIDGGVHLIMILVVAKIIGIIAGSVWNYMWYSRVVFKKGAV